MTTATLEDMARRAADNTSEALSTLLRRQVTIEFEEVGIKKVDDLCPLLAPEEVVATVLMPVTGDAEGAAMLVLPSEAALSMTDSLVGTESGTHRQLTEFGRSALKEVGNIIAGAYLTVVSNVVRAKLVEHVPTFAYDMFGAAISQVASKFAEDAEDAFVVEVQFSFPPERIKGYFLLILKREDSEEIFRQLGNS